MTQAFDKEFVESVIEHMNTDHADAVSNYMKAFSPDYVNLSLVQSVSMIDACPNHIELELKFNSGENNNILIPYTAAGLPPKLERPEQLRGALVTMSKVARKFLEDKK